MPSRLTLASLLAAPLALGCSDDAPVAPDGPPPGTPTALARCADPARPITPAWEVDNIRTPLLALTQLGSTIVVASGDGAVKTWVLDGAGSPSDPAYGTPFVDDGDVVTALAAGAGAIAGLDGNGWSRLWSTTGAVLHPPLALTPAAGTYVAVDEHQRWIAGGSEVSGGPSVANLETGVVDGPLATEMWNVTDAVSGHGGRLVTVGHWYGCPAIEHRDPREPGRVLGYWDGCRGALAATGWLRAVALDPYATTAIAVGDGLVMRFDLSNLAAGPVAVAETTARLDAVQWSADDEVAITLGTDPDGGSTLTAWTTDDLVARRAIDVPAAIGLSVDRTTGLLITARADGMVRADRCGE
jgi:hypothetical protein